ncbi:MAG: zf-HC2 domain-containing protein [Armatimonadota bacterium]|nr:zf-HC2 domain-containing protein [Armatimonadota bacterium]MDW8290121.1 zf-HC2 domain-containing protein [Armatimonadota bacterium]
MRVCAEWWTMLSAYVDDCLSLDERERTEAHLETCPGCRQAVMDLQALRQSMRQLPRPEPPPMLKARILAATVDQPTWMERLAMGWKPLAWRLSLATAAAVLAWIGWTHLPREVPQAVNTLVSSVTQSPKSAPSMQSKPSAPRTAPKVVASSEKRAPSSARRVVASRPLPAVRPEAPRRSASLSSVTRVPVQPEPVPADVLQGEPVIEHDVPYIDVTSPPAGAGEPVATQPEDGESRTVATRFTIPAEVLPQDTSAMEALRQQIRIQNQEQWSGQVKRKLQRNQVDIDVITVRF